MDEQQKKELSDLMNKIRELQGKLKKQGHKDSLIDLVDFSKEEPLTEKFKGRYDVKRLGIYHSLEFYLIDLKNLKSY